MTSFMTEWNLCWELCSWGKLTSRSLGSLASRLAITGGVLVAFVVFLTGGVASPFESVGVPLFGLVIACVAHIWKGPILGGGL